MIASSYRRRLERALWHPREPATPRWKMLGLQVLRVIAVLVRDNTRGELALRAMGLVYTTLLSLVPLLALSFSVLKAFGVHNQIRPLLENFLAPLGDSSNDLTGRIIGFIENMNVGVLGALGLALLLYTAVSLVQKVEEAFNFIWRISEPRSFGERFSRYLTLLLVGPILVFSAMGVTASAMNSDVVRHLLDIEPFGRFFLALDRLIPYFLVIAAFSVAYYFIPNTRVPVAAAVLGGVVAGAAWQTAGWVFAEFAASSRQYRAIYSGFAIVILFMIWLYLSWRIILLGASVSFYYQRPEYLAGQGSERRLSNRMREELALGIMGLLAGHFLDGDRPASADELAGRLNVPGRVLQEVLSALEDREIIAQVGSGPVRYLPTRDLKTLSLLKILEAVRSSEEDASLTLDGVRSLPAVSAALERMEEGLAAALEGLSAYDIAFSAPPPTRAVKSAPADRPPATTTGP